MPGVAVSAMALSAWLQGARPWEAKAGTTGYLQTQGAWQTLGCECRCTVVSPAWGTVLDSLVRPRVGSRCGTETGQAPWRPWWDQQDLGPLGAVPLRRFSQLPTPPFSRACQLLLLSLRAGIVMAAPPRVIVAILVFTGSPLFFIWRMLSLPLSSAVALAGASVLQPTLGTPVT